MSTFSYVKAQSLTEACTALGQPGAVAIAGGTDLLPRLRNETINPRVLVDLSGIEVLRKVQVSPEKITLGAGTKLADLLKHRELDLTCPELLKAVRRVASPQIRNAATLGGNLCQYTRCQYFNQSFHWRETLALCYRTGGDVCHQRKTSFGCVASFYSDIAPLLVAMDAWVVVAGENDSRTFSLSEMYLSDGSLSLHPGEVVTAVGFNLKKHQGRAFLERSLRSTIDFGLGMAAVVICVDPDQEMCQEAAIVLGAVAPFPFKAKEAEALLVGKRLNEEIIAEASRLAVEGLAPVPEPFCPSKYKKQLMKVLVSRAIKEAYAAALVSSG